MKPPVEIDGERLTIAELVRAARGAPVRLAAAAAARVEEAHRRLSEVAASGARIYGLTTGVGALERDDAPSASEQDRQRALLRSHAAGLGPAMNDEQVRAM